MCVCVCGCARACVRVCVCVRACVRHVCVCGRFPLRLMSSPTHVLIRKRYVLVLHREGEAVIFDDSFRHEVFASPTAGALGSVDALRVVLIVDIWHPDIPVSQRPLLLERLWEREEAASSFQL